MAIGYMETLMSSQTDGTALSGTTAASILPADAKYAIPVNGPGYGWRVGQVFWLEMWGRMSNIVTTPGTLTIDVRFGSVIVFTGGAMSLNTTAKTNVTWRCRMDLEVRAVGAGGSATANLMGTADFTSESIVSAAAGTANDAMMPASAPAVGTSWDPALTTAQSIDVFGTFSLTGNSLTVHKYRLLSIN